MNIIDTILNIQDMIEKVMENPEFNESSIKFKILTQRLYEDSFFLQEEYNDYTEYLQNWEPSESTKFYTK